MDTATAPLEFCVNGFGDEYIYGINREAFAKTGSAAVFDGYFGAELFDEHRLNVVIGTDSGLLIRHILRKGLPRGTRYLFIEPPHVLERLEEMGLLAGDTEEIACVSHENWRVAANRFKITEYLYINGVSLLLSIGARDANLDEYVELSWKLDDELTQLRWETIATIGGENFIACTIQNCADNIVSATILRGAYWERTAVLLGGGPSLDEALPWITANRDRLQLLAVSRIARRLLEVGLTPDFVFSVDPTDLSFDIGREMLKYPEDVVFVCADHASPLLLGQWHGPSLYLGALLPWNSELNRETLPHPGPTVTNTALAVATAMGFSRIVLAGIDLCFSAEGYTHAKGSNERSAGPRFNLSGMRTQTNGGWYANTTADLANAIVSMGMQAGQAKNAGVEVINPSPNAARIANVEHRPLEEIVLPPPQARADAPSRRIKAPSLEQKRKHYDALEAELRNAKHHADAVKSLAEEALACNDRMYSEDGLSITDVAAKERMDSIEEELNGDHPVFSHLIKTLGIRDLIKLTKPFDTEEMDEAVAKSTGEAYYKAYRDGADKLVKLVDAALSRVECRREEELDAPDWSKVLPRWEEDKHFRRASLWLARHPEADKRLAPRQRDALDALTQRYDDALNKADTTHLSDAKRNSALSASRHRARSLLKNQQIDELKKLAVALAQHPATEEAQPYRLLVDGYVAETNNDPQAALDAYVAIIDQQAEPVLEDTLLRVAHICLERGDGQNALFALEGLAQLSPIYHPQYAEVLKLTGQPQAAIDVYKDFLARFPGNLFVQLRLARLYLELGANDSAKELLQRVQEKHPDNEAAQRMLADTRKISWSYTGLP